MTWELETFIAGNAGVDLTPELPKLLELAATADRERAWPSLTLLALRERDLVIASLRELGALGPKLAWYLEQGSVVMPRAKLEWGDYKVYVRGGGLAWYAHDESLYQTFDEMLAGGPPRARPMPRLLQERLRAIVGGFAHENRAGARDRLICALGSAQGSCPQCAEIDDTMYANLTGAFPEVLPAVTSALLVAAERAPGQRELWLCPGCRAAFEFENEDDGIFVNVDTLTPITPEAALAIAADPAWFIVA